MKCSADVVTACDGLDEGCGFCAEHCTTKPECKFHFPENIATCEVCNLKYGKHMLICPRCDAPCKEPSSIKLVWDEGHD